MAAKVQGTGINTDNYTFTWTLTGCNPFAGWSVSPATSSAPVMVNTAAATLSLSCFFSQEGPATVACTITPINDTIPKVTLTPVRSPSSRGAHRVVHDRNGGERYGCSCVRHRQWRHWVMGIGAFVPTYPP